VRPSLDDLELDVHCWWVPHCSLPGPQKSNERPAHQGWARGLPALPSVVVDE
jgi:hypothetical protein